MLFYSLFKISSVITNFTFIKVNVRIMIGEFFFVYKEKVNNVYFLGMHKIFFLTLCKNNIFECNNEYKCTHNAYAKKEE